MNALGFPNGSGDGNGDGGFRTETGVRRRPSRRAASRPLVSVLVPLTGRVEPLAALYEEYAGALREAGHSHEFLFVASPRFTRELRPVLDLAASGEPIRVYSVGQSMADGPLLAAASGHVWGKVVVTLPSYRSVRPEALPLLVRKLSEGAQIAVARRAPREDPLINRVQARVFGGLLRRIAPSGIRDVGSGVRAMPIEVLQRLNGQASSHRFLPILAAQEGLIVREVDVPQHPQGARARLHRPDVYLQRLLDLFGLFFLLRFREKPLRFFGMLGAGAGAAGFAVLVALAFQRVNGLSLGDRPMLLVGLLGAVLGVQLVALGLIGEIIVHHHAPDWRPYRRRDGGAGPER